ncbi:MAG: SIS domain-containing protein [Anaerolineales bacterium]
MLANPEALDEGRAAALSGDTILEGKLAYTFGSGHSQLLPHEVQARADGLYPVVEIIDPLWGRAERLEGMGAILLKGIPFRAGETIFVISNSGRNPEPIEVAVTSLPHSRSVPSRHSSRKELFELGEVMLDTGAPALL